MVVIWSLMQLNKVNEQKHQVATMTSRRGKTSHMHSRATDSVDVRTQIVFFL